MPGALWTLRRYIYCENWKLIRKKRKPSVGVKVKGENKANESKSQEAHEKEQKSKTRVPGGKGCGWS